LLQCDLQLAGSSVGTGNPTEIEVAFRDDSGSVPITGTMAVYASTQIPVPGFSPEPLLTVPVTAADHGTLKAEDFASIADTLWPKGSVENGLYRFNVVVTGETQGSIVKGLVLRMQQRDFVLRDQDATAPRKEGVVTVQGAMAPLVTFEGALDTDTMNSDWDYFLFLYGTGYASQGDHGHFSIPKLPQGQYESHILLLPGKAYLSTGVDSTSVFGLTAPIEPGKGTLILGSVQARIPLPESLITQ
jgi:hypothetical protein